LGKAAKAVNVGYVVEATTRKKGTERSGVSWSKETPRECDQVATKGLRARLGMMNEGDLPAFPSTVLAPICKHDECRACVHRREGEIREEVWESKKGG
jgi:hypothetical protein